MKKLCTLIYFLSIFSFAMPPVFADNIVEDKQIVINQVNDDVQDKEEIEAIKPNTELDEKKLEQKDFTKTPYITEKLRGYIDRALQLNPTLKQRRLETEEAFYKNKESRTSLSPQVSFSASYSQSLRQPSRDSTGSFSYGFSLRQYITDFGKTSNALKGHFVSDGTKEKISKTLTGRDMPEEIRKKISIKTKGGNITSFKKGYKAPKERIERQKIAMKKTMDIKVSLYQNYKKQMTWNEFQTFYRLNKRRLLSEYKGKAI